MTAHIFGKPESANVLLQAIDERSLRSIDEEVNIIRTLTNKDFCLTVITVEDWFSDLSPWKAPAVFADNSFGDGAGQTLEFILSMCNDPGKDYYLGGYSLSGLFALWAAHQTNRFKGIASASPSIWFPDFSKYMETHDLHSNAVYLSLGDREGKTKNKIMATVDNCIKNAYDLLTLRGINCILEWNRGNHFTDVEKRCAKAFAWILEKAKQ